jgi:hypothetical protein
MAGLYSLPPYEMRESQMTGYNIALVTALGSVSAGEHHMLTVQEIEKEVARLSREELSRFRIWFEEFEAQLWDRQLESDAQSGKFDQLSTKAIREFQSGDYHEL